MQDTTSNNKRIAKNTIMLYIRMFISMLVGLYTSRVVLATLGVEDYGIYGVVGGVVGMMGFLNASMSGATSRFLTFELGKGDKERLAKTFSSALIVHIGIAIVVLILAETVGLWFLCNKLNIPAERMQAAHWVYQLSILSAMFGITQVPYNAAIIAHEKMDVYAYVEILNVSLKLLIVYLLTIGDFDKLKLYAVLTFAVSLIIMMIYRIYCLRHFKESRFHWVWDKTYLTPLLSFSGWSIYGDIAYTVRQQGANFLLNIFIGPAINAANMLGSTIQGLLMGFSSNIVMAFKPPIIKKFATANFADFNKLINLSVKAAQILLFIFTIPTLFLTKFILQFWLGQVPEGAIVITRLCLLVNIFASTNAVLLTAIQASGNIIKSSFICGTLYLLSIPAMYVFLKLGYGYEVCYWIIVAISFVFVIINSFVLKKNTPEFKISHFYFATFGRLIFLGVVSFLLIYQIKDAFNDNFSSFVAILLLTTMIIVTLSFILVFDAQERASIILFVKKRIPRWHR